MTDAALAVFGYPVRASINTVGDDGAPFKLHANLAHARLGKANTASCRSDYN